MSSRLFDLIFIFLTVWYYCTLTIRESILKVNGSRIKVRYRMHFLFRRSENHIKINVKDNDVDFVAPINII